MPPSSFVSCAGELLARWLVTYLHPIVLTSTRSQAQTKGSKRLQAQCQLFCPTVLVHCTVTHRSYCSRCGRLIICPHLPSLHLGGYHRRGFRGYWEEGRGSGKKYQTAARALLRSSRQSSSALRSAAAHRRRPMNTMRLSRRSPAPQGGPGATSYSSCTCTGVNTSESPAPLRQRVPACHLLDARQGRTTLHVACPATANA